MTGKADKLKISLGCAVLIGASGGFSSGAAAGQLFTPVSPNATTDIKLFKTLLWDDATKQVYEVDQNTINHIYPPIETGLRILQRDDEDRETTGPYYFNSIFSRWTSKVTGHTNPGRPGCACVSGLQVSMGVGGPNLDALELYAGSFGLTHIADDNSTSDKVGLSAGVYSNKSSPGKIYGASVAATVDKGSFTPQAIGLEIDSFVNKGGSTPTRIGLNVWNGGTTGGTDLDTAISVSNSGVKNATGGAFKKWFSIYTQGGRLNAPLAPDADFFYSDTDINVANIFNMANVHTSGYILRFPSVTLKGNGELKVSATTAYASPPKAGRNEVSYGGETVAASYCGNLQGAAGCVVINVAGARHYLPYW